MSNIQSFTHNAEIRHESVPESSGEITLGKPCITHRHRVCVGGGDSLIAFQYSIIGARRRLERNYAGCCVLWIRYLTQHPAAWFQAWLKHQQPQLLASTHDSIHYSSQLALDILPWAVLQKTSRVRDLRVASALDRRRRKLSPGYRYILPRAHTSYYSMEP